MNTVVLGLMVLTSTVEANSNDAPVPAMTAVRMSRAGAPGPSLGVYSRISSIIPADDAIASISPIGALVRFDIGATYAPRPDRGLSVELGLSAGAQTRSVFGSVSSLLGVTSLQASAVYRLPVWSYFGTYARGTGSVDWGHLTIRETGGQTEIDDVAVGFSGTGVLGADVAFPLGYTTIDSGEVADQFMSFYFEVGYQLSSKMNFDDLDRDVDPEVSIARVPLDAGDLSLSGVVWRVGTTFRF